jgi:hypothetical protein
MKRSTSVTAVLTVCPVHGVSLFAITSESAKPARSAPKSKSASAHLATDPKFGDGYEAIFGKGRRRITAAEASMN